MNRKKIIVKGKKVGERELSAEKYDEKENLTKEPRWRTVTTVQVQIRFYVTV